MGIAKVSTPLNEHEIGADKFFPGMVVSLCVPRGHRYLPLYVVLSFAIVMPESVAVSRVACEHVIDHVAIT